MLGRSALFAVLGLWVSVVFLLGTNWRARDEVVAGALIGSLAIGLGLSVASVARRERSRAAFATLMLLLMSPLIAVAAGFIALFIYGAFLP